MDNYTYEQAVAAGKKAVAAGDTESANEIASYIDSKGLKPTPVPLSEKAGGMVDRAGAAVEDFQQRGEATTGDFQQRAVEGFAGGGIGVSPTAHVVGAGIEYAAGRGVDFIKSFAPQEVQDKVATWAQGGMTATAEAVGNFLEKHPTAMEGVQALGRGYAAVSEWMQDNPALARDFETLFDIGSITMPAAKVGPVLDTALGETGKKLARKGIKQKIDEGRQGVRDLIYPDSRYGSGDTDEAGLLNTRTYDGTDREKEVSEALLLSDKIKPNRSYGYNQARAFEAVDTQRKELTKTIMKAGNPKVDKPDLHNEIAMAIEELGTLPGTELLVGDTKVMAENLLNTAMKLFDESSGRAMGVMQARRNFDKIVADARGDQFNPDKASAIQAVNRIVRDALNESVRKSVGGSGDDVYHFLRQQHLLLEGADTLYDNMKKEELNLVKRMWSNVTRLGHLPRTPLALGATMVVAAKFLPAASLVAGTALAGYGVKQAATSATSKRALGELLQNVNSAIKTSENSAMISQLKADRLLLIEMMRDSTPEEERIPMKGAGNGG